jgi:hypothetical protein
MGASKMKKNILAAVAVAAVIATPSVFAAPGDTESVSTGQLNRVEVKMGEDSYSVVNFKLVMVINKSTHELFKAGDVIAVSCVGINNTVNKESNVDGNCVAKDSAGDTFATTFKRKGLLGQPGAGAQTVRGLTGKYAGMTGTCSYDAKYAQNDGVFIASFAKCSYK